VAFIGKQIHTWLYLLAGLYELCRMSSYPLNTFSVAVLSANLVINVVLII